MRRSALKNRLAAALALFSLFSASLAAGYRTTASSSFAPPSNEPIYQGPASSRLIALTVNVDWGEEYLPEMLRVCESNRVRLTFFVTGRWAARRPDLVREMIAGGHEIGNHGYAHPHPDQLTVADNARDIQRAEDVLREITGSSPHLYAPPYGERGEAVLEAANSLGYATILWSADSLDWKYRDESAIIERVIRKAGPGGIVLLHPTKATVAALPTLIDRLRGAGLEPATVSGLLGAPD